jgi:hypothetical protein
MLPLGVLVAVGALALSGGARARASSEPRAGVTTSSHLQVTQVEYRLILSRGVVRAGPVDLQTIDGGMDPHDLRLRHIDAKQEIAAPELTPGRRWDGVVNLKPGLYHLWCSLPEHAKLGMHATLRVVR